MTVKFSVYEPSSTFNDNGSDLLDKKMIPATPETIVKVEYIGVCETTSEEYGTIKTQVTYLVPILS